MSIEGTHPLPATSDRGRTGDRCSGVFAAVPPTSVQPERDCSALEFMLGDPHAKIRCDASDGIFELRSVFEEDRRINK